jgi:ribosomal protein S18 acetylase RimI-like enzyme
MEGQPNGNGEEVTIRQATAEDYAPAAELMYSTGEALFRCIFYPDREETLELLREFFKAEENAFTYQNAYVAESEGEVVGLIHFADREEEDRNNRGMGRQTIQLLGLFPTLWRMPRFIQLGRVMGRASDDSVYIRHVAVFPAYRRRGIASRLLAFCEEEAERRGISKLALDVVTDNEPALRAYQKYGFEIVDKVVSERFIQACGLSGLYLMEKRI